MDRHGVPADVTLFLDRMPQQMTESELRKLIHLHGGGSGKQLVNIWFGTKALAPGEFRTATAKFETVDAAVCCRKLLQHFQGENWPLPLRVNFVRKREGAPRIPGAVTSDKRRRMSQPGFHLDGGQHFGMEAPNFHPQFHAPYMFQPQMVHQPWHRGGAEIAAQAPHQADLDKHGTPACPTLFLPNLPHNATEQTVRAIFPLATGVYCSTKPLAETERRTSYVSFQTTEVAVQQRRQLDGAKFEAIPALSQLCVEADQLLVCFSKRGQDRVWSAGQQRGQQWQEDMAESRAPYQHLPSYHPGYCPPHDEPPSSVPFGFPCGQGNSMRYESARVQQAPRGVPREAIMRADRPCHTLYLSRLPRTATELTVRELFPTATRVFCSKKPLREGEDRTAYVAFESVEVAAQEMQRMNGFRNDFITRPLAVAYSTKEQDQAGSMPR